MLSAKGHSLLAVSWPVTVTVERTIRPAFSTLPPISSMTGTTALTSPTETA
ncbi:hypothetical protein BMS3Abin14_00995 [bacterium BMS3Abin14]|nr:hypothetical protein BMS3Abin14_00995 [bacterium BMS3Abin14]